MGKPYAEAAGAGAVERGAQRGQRSAAGHPQICGAALAGLGHRDGYGDVVARICSRGPAGACYPYPSVLL